jgi:hypothetical protein
MAMGANLGAPRVANSLIEPEQFQRLAEGRIGMA